MPAYHSAGLGAWLADWHLVRAIYTVGGVVQSVQLLGCMTYQLLPWVSRPLPTVLPGKGGWGVCPCPSWLEGLRTGYACDHFPFSTTRGLSNHKWTKHADSYTKDDKSGSGGKQRLKWEAAVTASLEGLLKLQEFIRKVPSIAVAHLQRLV